MELAIQGITAAVGLIGVGLIVLSVGWTRAATCRASRDARYRAIVEHAGEGILVADAATGRVIDANPVLLRKLDYRSDELSSLRVEDILIEDVNETLARATRRAPTLARTTREISQRGRDGSLVPVDVSVSGFDVEGRAVICYIIRDATQRKLQEGALKKLGSDAEERAQYLASRDPVTRLQNRHSFRRALANAIENVPRDGALALLLFDIKDFSSINDTLGLAVGDAVLVEVATRLRQALGETRISRLGNDEFAVTLQPADPDAALQLALDIQSALAKPVRGLGHELDIHVSVGISLCPPDGADVDGLLSHADLALAQARSAVGDEIRFYSAEMNATVHQRLTLAQGLKQAIQANELIVHYQPVVDIASRRVLSLEALVRWQHPRLGMISPGDFIPLAEQSGLIVPLGERVLRLVCEEVVRWRKDGVPVVPVAVNLSPQQFRRQSVSQLVLDMLRETGMAACDLAIEITEDSLMREPERYASELQVLRTAGVKILVDDFGTGYSSLNYLKRLPLDTLKIDRGFISHIDTDSADEAIVSAILAMARSLDLRVVAEGVESQYQLDVLQRHGCQMAQGFYFSRPIEATRCVTLLHELSLRPSFTETLRMRLNDVEIWKKRRSGVR